MNTKSKITVIAAASVIIGYTLGAMFGLPGTSGNLGSGDISKVSKFHKTAVGSQASALEEKLRSDTLAFNQESATVAIINSRMNDFADLVDYAIIAAADKDELSEQVNSLVNVKELSMNAVQAGKIASASLEYLESGEKNELVTDYEQASQNLVVAFMMVDRQVQLGKQFVAAADEYLVGKSLEDVPEIALVRDLWAEYCAESAWINGDKQEMTYWGNQDRMCNQELLGKATEHMSNIISREKITYNKLSSDDVANKLTVDGEFANKFTDEVFAGKLSGEQFANLIVTDGMAAKFDEEELAGKFSSEELAGKFGSEGLAGKFSSEELAGKFGSEKLAGKFGSEELAGKFGSEGLAGKFGSEKLAGKFGSEGLASKLGGPGFSSKFNGEGIASKVNQQEFSNRRK